MPRMDKLSPYRTTWTQDGDNIVVCRLGRSPEGYASAGTEHGAVVIPFTDGMSFPRGTVR